MRGPTRARTLDAFPQALARGERAARVPKAEQWKFQNDAPELGLELLGAAVVVLRPRPLVRAFFAPVCGWLAVEAAKVLIVRHGECGRG